MNNKIVVRLSKQNVISWMATSFIAMIAIGAYYQINFYIIAIYAIASVPLFLTNAHAVFAKIKNNSLIRMWIIYIFVSFLSTFINGKLFFRNTTFINFSFIFIGISIAASTDRITFYRIFTKFITVLSTVVLITQIIHVDLFGLIKSGTVYYSVDTRIGGGVSSLFEYRHYYGVMLSCAFFINLFYGYEKRKFLTGCILFINIILTYTRNIWLALLFGIIIYFVKEKKHKIKSKYLLNASGILVCVLFIGALFPELWLPILENIVNRFIQAQVSLSTYSYGGVRGYVIIRGTQHIFGNWKRYLIFGGGDGFAMDWLKSNPYGYGWTDAIDVQYITVLMNTGIVGIAVIIALIMKVTRRFIFSKRNSDYLTELIVIIMSISFCFFDVFGLCTSIYAFWIFIICFGYGGNEIR